jgi:hypothetical protein
MGQTLYKRVRRFLHETTGVPIERIAPDSSLYLDLEVTQETAPPLIARFGAEFDIDVSSINLTGYFLSAPHVIHDGVAGLVFAAFVASDRHRRAGVKPLLVKDLVNAAQEKRWCV